MAQKLEAIGSTNGFTFDDGSDHDSVSKIFVGGGLQGILYMEFEYVRSGQLKFGSLVGRRHRGFIETVCRSLTYKNGDETWNNNI